MFDLWLIIGSTVLWVVTTAYMYAKTENYLRNLKNAAQHRDQDQDSDNNNKHKKHTNTVESKSADKKAKTQKNEQNKKKGGDTDKSKQNKNQETKIKQSAVDNKDTSSTNKKQTTAATNNKIKKINNETNKKATNNNKIVEEVEDEEEEEGYQEVEPEKKRKRKRKRNKKRVNIDNLSYDQYNPDNDGGWIAVSKKGNAESLKKDLNYLKVEEGKLNKLVQDQRKKLQHSEQQLQKEQELFENEKVKYRQQISALQSSINESKKKGGVIDPKDVLAQRNYVRSGAAEKVKEINLEMAKDAFTEHDLRSVLQGLKEKVNSLEKELAALQTQENRETKYDETWKQLKLEKEELDARLIRLKKALKHPGDLKVFFSEENTRLTATLEHLNKEIAQAKSGLPA